MADQQPLNATFFAFKKRDRGGVLFGASVAFVIMAIVMIGLFVVLFAPILGPVLGWYAQVFEAALRQDNAAIQALGVPQQFWPFLGALLVWLFPFYILCAAYEAACLRWMIHGEQQGFVGLTLSAPTWRVWGCYWIWFLLNIAFSIALGIVTSVVMGILAMGTLGDPSTLETARPIVKLFQNAMMAFFAIRFAPAAATTIARRKFSFFEAWTVTKGRFWALFGSFFLLWAVYFIVVLGVCVGWFAMVLGPSVPDLAAITSDPEQFKQVLMEALRTYLQSLQNPQDWLALVVLQCIGMLIGAVFYVATYGINARAAIAALEEGKIKPAAA